MKLGIGQNWLLTEFNPVFNSFLELSSFLKTQKVAKSHGGDQSYFFISYWACQTWKALAFPCQMLPFIFAKNKVLPFGGLYF